MIYIENKIDDLVNYFKQNENIVAVWIIGSYGTEFQREDSDVDFAILFSKELNLWDEIGIEADITSIIKYENIDLVNLKKAPISLRFKAIKYGRSIYEADYIKVCDFEEETINRYQERKYYMDAIDRDYFGRF